MSLRQPRIGVIGPSQTTPEVLRDAESVGVEIARRGAILVCGGLGGVMEAAARGAKSAGGFSVGILPGTSVDDANPHIDIPIATGMGEARNVLVVRASDALIAIAGGFGTLSEIGFALKTGKPLVGLNTWKLDVPIVQAQTPAEAVAKVFELLRHE
jgi:uncharacterized protein (TIGR00725 family)